jgi:hypothetical protein
MPTQVGLYSETDCRSGRIEVIIPFEMPPVLLKYNNLAACWCTADLGRLNIVQFQPKLAKIQNTKIHFLHCKIIGAPKKFKNKPRALLR